MWLPMLSARKIRFVHEYCVDWNATKAYIRAGYSEKGAGQSAHELLKSPEIADRITERKEELAAKAELDASWVLKQWRDIATADTNELMQVQRVCCRFCWGLAHEYQWTEREYRQALDTALNATPPKPVPDGMGGFGFDPTADPCPACPECHGEGLAHLHIADTRKLKGSARRLYAGVKRTKDGIEIKTRDKDAAVANIARYLGMPLERKELSGPGGGPVALVATIRAEDLTDDELAARIVAGSK